MDGGDDVVDAMLAEAAIERPENAQRGVRLNATALDAVNQGLAVRGWNYGDWARAAGLAQSTAFKLVHGRSVSPRSLIALAHALEEHPADSAAVRLLTGDLK